METCLRSECNWQLGAIDGPLPDALTGQGQYVVGSNGMLMSPVPGQPGMHQQHMGQGIPGVDLYSSQGTAPAANASIYGSQQQRMQMQMQPQQQPGSGGEFMCFRSCMHACVRVRVGGCHSFELAGQAKA